MGLGAGGWRLEAGGSRLGICDEIVHDETIFQLYCTHMQRLCLHLLER